MSADFGNHPGGFFTLSTLRELRRKNFELIAYATIERKDEFSPHFRPLFAKWNLIEKKLKKHKTKFIPIDSEHFAIHELIKKANFKEIKNIYIIKIY